MLKERIKYIFAYMVLMLAMLGVASGAIDGAKINKFIKNTISCAGCGDEGDNDEDPGE